MSEDHPLFFKYKNLEIFTDLLFSFVFSQLIAELYLKKDLPLQLWCKEDYPLQYAGMPVKQNGG